jgi:hypothetical protein
MLIMADPSSVGFYRAEGANLERHQEVVPGFVLGVYWYDLTQGAARHQDSGPAGPGTTAS